MILAGLVMTFVPAEPIEIPGILPSLPGSIESLKRGTMIIAGGMFCSLLLWVWLQRYLPKLPYFNKLILTTVSGNVAVNQSDVAGAVEAVSWPAVGSRGKAMTDLRPGGTAAFLDPAINDLRGTDVISESGFLRAGTAVVVREASLNRIIVRAAPEQQAASSA
jgi:hypothetical protein